MLVLLTGNIIKLFVIYDESWCDGDDNILCDVKGEMTIIMPGRQPKADSRGWGQKEGFKHSSEMYCRPEY